MCYICTEHCYFYKLLLLFLLKQFQRRDCASQTNDIFAAEGLSEFTERLLAEKDAEVSDLQAALARMHHNAAEAAAVRTETHESCDARRRSQEETEKQETLKRQLRSELEETRMELVTALEQLRVARDAVENVKGMVVFVTIICIDYL